MGNGLSAALVFGFVSFLQLWGGAAIGAGLRGRRLLAVLWGVLVGVTPLGFGIERGIALGAWSALAWQVGVLVASALLTATRLSRLRSLFERRGADAIMTGTILMAMGALLGAWLLRVGSEIGSLLAGGAGFMLGAIWVGAGLSQLRQQPHTR